VTLTTYLGGSLQESISGGSLINILGIGGGQNISATFCQPFDQIRITAGSLAGVLASYRIFNAYVISDCQYPVPCGTPATTEICGDGIDNDGDYLVDSEDNCITLQEICNNGIDDDCASNAICCDVKAPVLKRLFWGVLIQKKKIKFQYSIVNYPFLLNQLLSLIHIG